MFGPLAQLAEQRALNPRVGGSSPSRLSVCGSSSVVEHHVANVRVGGSNPLFRLGHFKYE